MLFRKNKSLMPTAETALPGRSTPIPTADEHDIFSRPDFIIEAGDPSTWSVPNDPSTPENEFRQHTAMQGDILRFVGGEHVVMGGTAGANKLRADLGDDTLWGEGGADRSGRYRIVRGH